MKKASLFALTFVISSISLADASLYKKYYYGSFDFDGNKASNARSGISYNNNEKWAKSEDSTLKYNMSWKTNDEGVTTISDSAIIKGPNNSSTLAAQVSSFSQDKLRATTVCYNSDDANEMKCVTATRRACDRILNEYAKTNKLSDKNIKETVANGEKCLGLMDKYKSLAKEYANQSNQMESRQKEVISDDLASLRKHINDSVGNKIFNYKNLTTAVSEKELSKTVDNFTNSMDGLRAMNQLLDLCYQSRNDFANSGSASQGRAGNSNSGTR